MKMKNKIQEKEKIKTESTVNDLDMEVWLVLRVLTSWPSTLANCLLELLFWQSFDYEQVKNIGLLAVKLVLVLVAGASSQLISLFIRIILGPGIGKTV